MEIVGVWFNPNTFADAVALAADSKEILAGLDTEVFALPDVAGAFVRAAANESSKVLVKP